MAGPLSDEKLNALRRVSRKFGYYPSRDDVDCLLATVDVMRQKIDVFLGDEAEAKLEEMRRPLEERLDPNWVAREALDVDQIIETTRALLAEVQHPDTGVYGLISALVLAVERCRNGDGAN